MLLPEFKTILMLNGWTMNESIYFILWQKDKISLQWDRETTSTFKQIVFCLNKANINTSNQNSKRRKRRLTAYTSFQECIDDLE